MMQLPADPSTTPPWVGVIVAIVIGMVVRFLKLPVPSPPTVWGALMVLGLTLGYLAANWYLTR